MNLLRSHEGQLVLATPHIPVPHYPHGVVGSGHHSLTRGWGMYTPAVPNTIQTHLQMAANSETKTADKMVAIRVC